MSQKTVFISFRRTTGGALAHLLREYLSGHGYDVFLDSTGVESAEWRQTILSKVPVCAHFLLLLTPQALEGCADPNDRMRRELESAMETGRNFVPVCEGDLDCATLKAASPTAMSRIFDLPVARIRYDAVDHDLQELLRTFIPPRKVQGGLAHPSQRIAVSRLPEAPARLVGRDDEFARLDAAWADPSTHVVTLVAWGGVGKTSLAATWAAKLASRGYDGADYFDWSFYSQGTGDHGGASSGSFIAAALRFFGDAEASERSSTPWDKSARLAELVAERRTLLVLDGLEPLLYPPGPLRGELKDDAMRALLTGLAARNSGLCLVTTREPIPDLGCFRSKTVQERTLEHLSTDAGVWLLETLGVVGPRSEMEAWVEEVRGHALTLHLLGRFLLEAFGGDVRRRDGIDFGEADASIQGGHAFRVMAAYERWLDPPKSLSRRLLESIGLRRDEHLEGRRQLSILRLLGLFDRPADSGCLLALRRWPVIAGLTDTLVGLSEEQWDRSVQGLQRAALLVRDGNGGLDTHPLIREYFARRLRADRAEAWKAAHSRLFDHLSDTTRRYPETLEGLEPLYQAVVHGCRADRHEEARADVYRDRISRGVEAFVVKKLGAFGVDLGAITCFFDEPWRRVSSSLSEADQAWLLNEAAFRLRALGRLREAVEPMRAALSMALHRKSWQSAAVRSSNLSELELALGDVAAALSDAQKSVAFGERGRGEFLGMAFRTGLADALHQAGQREEAHERFREAESMQAEQQIWYPLLYSLQGFRYCDLLLGAAERAAAGVRCEGYDFDEDLRQVEGRARVTLEWARQEGGLLNMALDHLTLGRLRLYRALLEGTDPDGAESEIEAAVDGLRHAGDMSRLPWGLLSRAWLRHVQGRSDVARADLDEAEHIARRGPMPLFLADVALYRARFFDDRGALGEARRLIDEHGYGRRREEVSALEATVGCA